SLFLRSPRGTPSPPALPPFYLSFHHLCLCSLPTNGVNGYSLHPPYFNLAEGTKITATATCGEDDTGRSVQDLYCKLVGGPVSGDPSQTIQSCCSSIDGPNQVKVLFISVSSSSVSLQLFHVAYVLIKFANSPRPDLWVLERSVDFGQTYQPWQYFASSKRDCIERFGQSTIERISHDDDIVCTTEYSRIVPLENGEIVVSLVNGRPGAMNFSYSPVLREFTKATNIRLRFLRTNTLLGHLMGKALRDPTVTRRYYYSIKDISIGGRCVCNGHAEACNAKDPTRMFLIHTSCDCQHHTCGVSCDQCCPGYHQLAWKPATTYSANECERECVQTHRHTHGVVTPAEKCASCVGICTSCFHLQAACDCDVEFTDGTCEDLTGRCFCKPNYTGENCDSCAAGFTGFPECYREPAGEIITCQCAGPGCLDGSCDEVTGHGVCRGGFQGPQCDRCAPGYFSYPLCQRKSRPSDPDSQLHSEISSSPPARV
uniref:Laminin, alpha 5 n=1 Tax=Haplochromis burtoni TaxID=8153 RepID=A0A3Q2VIY2_HAPBU